MKDENLERLRQISICIVLIWVSSKLSITSTTSTTSTTKETKETQISFNQNYQDQSVPLREQSYDTAEDNGSQLTSPTNPAPSEIEKSKESAKKNLYKPKPISASLEKPPEFPKTILLKELSPPQKVRDDLYSSYLSLQFPNFDPSGNEIIVFQREGSSQYYDCYADERNIRVNSLPLNCKRTSEILLIVAQKSMSIFCVGDLYEIRKIQDILKSLGKKCSYSVYSYSVEIKKDKNSLSVCITQ